jgi:ubiquinone/menaquinone biosynthesis C-methylase UbiE
VETLSIKKFYDAFAPYYDRFYDPIDYHAWAGILQHHIDALLPGPRRILDAGCGTGSLLQELASDPNNRCLGLDCSAAMLHICQQKIATNSRFDLVQSDLLASCLLPESFDVVLGAFSLLNSYSLPLRRALLAEAWRVLKPNGIFLTDFFTVHRFAQLQLAAQRGEELVHQEADFRLQQNLLANTNQATQFPDAGAPQDRYALERTLSLSREGIPASRNPTQRLYFLEPEEIQLDFVATGYIIVASAPLVRDSRTNAPNRLMLIGRKPCPSSTSKSSTIA